MAKSKCWIWQGVPHTKRMGYGRVKIKGKNMLVHRLSYEIAYGSFDKNLKVLHRCDVPMCFNPQHLFLGTVADNVRDMYQKKRAVIGSKKSNSKISEKDATEIRRLYNECYASQRFIAGKYKISKTAVQAIISNKTWKHI